MNRKLANILGNKEFKTLATELIQKTVVVWLVVIQLATEDSFVHKFVTEASEWFGGGTAAQAFGLSILIAGAMLVLEQAKKVLKVYRENSNIK